MSMEKTLEDMENAMKTLSEDKRKLQDPFSILSRRYLEEGALSEKTKRIMAVSLALCQRCDYCIAHHVEGALKAGASKDELIEAGYVAVLMSGGPAMTYMTKLLEAIEQFQEKE